MKNPWTYLVILNLALFAYGAHITKNSKTPAKPVPKFYIQGEEPEDYARQLGKYHASTGESLWKDKLTLNLAVSELAEDSWSDDVDPLLVYGAYELGYLERYAELLKSNSFSVRS